MTTLQPRIVDDNPLHQVAAVGVSLAAPFTAAAQLDPRQAVDFAHITRPPTSSRPLAPIRPAKAFAPFKSEVAILSPLRPQSTPPLEVNLAPPVLGVATLPPNPAASHALSSGLMFAGSINSLEAGISLDRAAAAPYTPSPMTPPALGNATFLGVAR